MKNNLKISLIALSTLLTACGGGGSGSGNSVPTTTLPRTETITTMKTSVDNKSEIIGFVEDRLGTITAEDYTEEVASKYDKIHAANPSRSATSTNTRKENLTLEEMKYRVAQVKLSYVEDLKNALNDLSNQTEEFLSENKSKFIDALKLIDKKDVAENLEKAEDTSIKDSLDTLGDIAYLIDDILRETELKTQKLEDVEFYTSNDGRTLNYTVEKDKVTGIEFVEYEDEYVKSDDVYGENRWDGEHKVTFKIDDFKEDKDGFIIGTANDKQSYKYYTYDEDGIIDFSNNLAHEAQKNGNIESVKDNREKDNTIEITWNNNGEKETKLYHSDGIDFTSKYEIILGGKSVGLSYSDFAFVNETILSASRPIDLNGNLKLPFSQDGNAFYGGYENKEVAGSYYNSSAEHGYPSRQETDLDNIDDLKDNKEIAFSGKAIGTASAEGHQGINLKGTADMTVSLKGENVSQNIDLKFDNFYDVNYKDGEFKFSNPKGDYGYLNAFKDFTGTENEEKLYTKDNTMENDFYGDNNKLEEVVGRLHLSEKVNGDEFEFEAAFGAKRK